MNSLHPNAPRKRASNTALQSKITKSPRLKPERGCEQLAWGQDAEAGRSSPFPGNVKDTGRQIQPDNNSQPNEMADLTKILEALELQREDHEKQQAEAGRRESKAIKKRVHAGDGELCCRCGKYPAGKGSKYKHCCKRCDEDGPSCITMGLVEGAFE
ncbi:hypothetical protein F66182_6475 [Fusarium sp. NRRL 66182]|nr:hypothetical protein F66182_6475 [Fusarium sp. NRRL 66182]